MFIPPMTSAEIQITYRLLMQRYQAYDQKLTHEEPCPEEPETLIQDMHAFEQNIRLMLLVNQQQQQQQQQQ
jgi:hypothetical protein